MKKSHRKKLTISIVIFALSLILAGNIFYQNVWSKDYDFVFFDFGGNNDAVLNKEYVVDDSKEIYLDLSSIDLNVYKSTDDKIYIEAYDINPSNITISFEDGILRITETGNQRVCIFCTGNDSHIDIYVPVDYEGSTTLKNTSGDINIADIEDMNLNLEVTSGDIEINRVGNINVITESGDVEISSAKEITFSSKSGDLTVHNGIVKDIVTENGDVELEYANILTLSKIATSTGDVILDEISDAKVSYDTESGQVKISDTSFDTERELTVTTKSGNIYVNQKKQ